MKEASSRAVSCKSSEVVKHITDFKSVIDNIPTDDSLDWSLELSETEIPDDEGKLLTSLVRKTYIHHLQKSLLHNYECWFKSYGDGVELSESFISRCAAQLEKKALRACMLASLYQHSVVKLIKGIKKSTNNKKLYEDLLTSINCSKKCDKSIQTDFNCLFNSDHCSSENERFNADSVPAGIQSSVVSGTLSSSQSVTDDLSRVHSIIAATNPQPVPNPFSVSSKITAPKFVLSYLPKNDATSESKCSKIANVGEGSAEVSSSKMYDPEIDIFQDDRFTRTNKENSVGLKRKTKLDDSLSLKRRKSDLNTSMYERTLDERLKKIEEIFGNTCEDVPPDKSFNKGNFTKFFSLVSWKQESVAQTCELNRKLLAMPPFRLKIVESCFKRLFGENDPITDITPEDFSHCRKRLANIIVCQLTPYFELGQIGSREVFKAIAREITRIILNETYAADMQFSQSTVDNIFQNGIKYMTLEDVNILCYR